MTRFFARLHGLWRDSATFRAAAAFLGLAGVLLYLNWNAGGLVVRMEIESAIDGGVVAIYYDAGKGIREEDSVGRPLRKGLHRYELPLPTSRVRTFRLDPSTHDQVTRIRNLEAVSHNRVIRTFDASQLVPVNEIVYAQAEESGRSLRFTVKKGGQDPYFMVHDSALQALDPDLSMLITVLFVSAFSVLAVLVAMGNGGPAIPANRVPAARLGIVIGVALAMAALAATAHSVSPDEHSHLFAGRYYLDNWLPPKVGAEGTLGSYSAYGASYLNEPDIVYVIAAKFVVVTAFTGLDDLVRFRLFNIALLMLCLLLALRRPLAMWITLPLLCTPQAWYVFAYFNSDAFGLAIAAILGAVFLDFLERVEAVPETAAPPPGKFLPRAEWVPALTVGVLLALALLSKKTFYPFIVFIGAYGLWRVGFRSRLAYALGTAGLFLLALWYYAGPPSPSLAAPIAPAARGILAAVIVALAGAAAWLSWRHRARNPSAARALFAVAAIGVALAGCRFLIDTAINGWPWEHSRAITAIAERVAQPNFRPSVMGAPDSYFGLVLASKGTGLEEMLFSKYQWVSSTKASFFGLYGYMNVVAPGWMYQTLWNLGLVFFCLVVLVTLRTRGSRAALVMGLIGIALALLLSIMHSWTRDLQPQGRYLLVILPILGAMIAVAAREGAENHLGMRLLRVTAGVMFVLGLYSFAFVGLPGVTRS